MRFTHLQIVDLRLLQDWGDRVRRMFRLGPVGGLYLVGSALERPDYRDVDVRAILADKDFDKLAKRLDTQDLGVAVSLWGQRTTGLPIDFQVQKRSAANAAYEGRRHPLLIIRHEDGA